jgi:D-lactate dehydrogenase (cytochrome)
MISQLRSFQPLLLRPGSRPRVQHVTTGSFPGSFRLAEPAFRFNSRLGHHSLVRREKTAKRMFYGSLFITGIAIVGNCAYLYSQNASTTSIGPFNSTSVSHLNEQSKSSYAWNVTESNIIAAAKELVEILGEGGVSFDPAERLNHSSTAWSEAPNADKDRGSLVVYPRSTKDVAGIAKICHKRRIPMIPFSGGTSLESTLAAIQQEIFVDFSRMNKIIQLHEEDMDVIVEPGVGFEQLNEFLASKKLFFPPDPGPGAQIGGMIGQGCSGTNAYRYGTMKDWVLGVTVVLADGTVIKTRHRPRKSSAGYDLTRLFVGSEGTLGFVTEASLRLAPKPENTRVAVAVFPDINSAIRTSVNIVKCDLALGAMELLDDKTMRALNLSGHLETEWPERTTLFFKLSGSPTQIAQQAKDVESLAKEQHCTLFTLSKSDKEADSLWLARKTALWSLSMLKEDPDDKFLSADICVPISRLGDMIAATNASFDSSGLVGSCLGHVGDGNYHASLFFGVKDKDKARALLQEAQKLGIEMGGTVTGEHGIGLINREALVWELGEESVAAMRRIKIALDPHGLMNPGKMFKLWPDQQ